MAGDLHQSGASRDRDDDAPEPPQIRRFRRLVSATMVVMMIGMLGIMGALVWKLTRGDENPRTSSAFAELSDVDGKIALAPDMTILSISRAGDSVYLLLENLKTGERTVEETRAHDLALIRRYRLVAEED